MISILKNLLILAIAIVLVVLGWKWMPRQDKESEKPVVRAKPVKRMLSSLAPLPDWKRLEAYQGVMTKGEFVGLLEQQFSPDGGWKGFIEVDDKEARIKPVDKPGVNPIALAFATGEGAKVENRYWKKANEMEEPPAGMPLLGVTIAIDPGHIGGNWATIEERSFKIGDRPAVNEGDMTLLVAKKLKERLEALGACVKLVRNQCEPVTKIRAEELVEVAKRNGGNGSAEAIKKESERLFYRTAEIRARAKLVNLKIKPDLVLCLHFNAEGWGDSMNPVLVDGNHFHLLVNGAYTKEELDLEDQRLSMLEKLLSRATQEEVEVAKTIADHYGRATGMKAYRYQEAARVQAVEGQPYVWVRNLLANRLYECPVIFMEPYVMNSREDYERIQAGDYEGYREVGGKLQRSIFREYADELAYSLAIHYRKARKKSHE